MNKYIYIVCFLCAQIFFSSCATLKNGTQQTISFQTEPAGATISTGNQEVVSPGELQLHRGCDHIITIAKPGHKTETVKMSRVLNSTAVSAVVLPGGLISYGVDAITGAQWDFECETIALDLQKLRRGEQDTASNTIAVLEQLKVDNPIAYTIYENMKKTFKS